MRAMMSNPGSLWAFLFKGKMKKLSLAGILLALVIAGNVAAQPVMNPYCPVMPGERTKEKFYVDHQGKRVYLCCRSCVKAFKKHPERYLRV